MTASVSDVAAALPQADVRGDDVDLVDASHDSRQVGPGWLFCAIRGSRADGHEHAPRAIEQGAGAVLVDHWLDLPVTQIRVPDVRAAAGPAAAAVHGHPSRDLQVIGVTGTNGKTTTVYLLEAAFAAAAMGTGVIGTVETRIHGEAQPGVRTTPEGPDLQRLLRRMHDRGADAVAMEVSSHGLDMHRVDGTRFAVGVWTNLTQDHLDWHGTMEAYFAAKARLFTPALTDHGVVFLDGPGGVGPGGRSGGVGPGGRSGGVGFGGESWGRRLLEVAEVDTTTVGRGPEADIRIVDEHADVTGSRARLVGEGLDLPIGTGFPGRFNLSNAATAVVAAITAGIPAEVAATGVAACPGAPGRLERVDVGQPFTVLVDYAHTPDAIEQVVATMRDLLEPGRRIVLVLGAGGDRDRAKRGPMGAAAALADVAVFTSDNPRSEDPQAILDAVVAGAREAVDAGAPAEISAEPDRRDAIRRGLGAAGEGDVVVIAGKGHETGQEFADRTLPFDDRVVARELLQQGAA